MIQFILLGAVLLFYIIGQSLLIHCRKHIVIANRRPILLSLEIFNAMAPLVANLLRLNCLIVTCLTIVSLHLQYIRFTFLLNYIDTNHRFACQHRIFWRRNRLRLGPFFISLFIPIALTTTSMFIVDQDKVLKWTCPQLTLMARLPFIYVYYIIFAIYAVYIVKNQIKDRIGFRTELLGHYMGFLFGHIAYIPLLLLLQVRFEYLYIVLVFNTLFWGFYFPMLYLLKRERRHIKVLGNNVDMTTLMRETKLHFCEELAYFVRDYHVYLSAPTNISQEVLMNTYIERDGLYAINLPDGLRKKIIEDPTQLKKAHEAVLEMIYANVFLPIRLAEQLAEEMKES